MSDLELTGGQWVVIGGVSRFIPVKPTPEPPKWGAKCGTTSGARKHRRLGEQVCIDCLNADRDYARRRRGITGPAPLKPHGTHAAFHRHLYNKSKPCDRCVDAERQYQREARREQRARARKESA